MVSIIFAEIGEALETVELFIALHKFLDALEVDINSKSTDCGKQPRGRISSMWDERYQTDDFVYGKEPNSFLKEASYALVPGRVLCLAEGEGRNAIFLAECGHQVTAVDASAVGLKKAQRLAAERGVQIQTEVVDLADYKMAEESWDAIVSIFCHVPQEIRTSIHKKVIHGLKAGGFFILEAYTPAQLKQGTGGPPVRELMMTLADLRQELAGLDLEHALETEREVIEGSLHTGRGAVVQIIARKSSD